MRIAFFGDVVGRAGRHALSRHLLSLRRELGLDFVIVNGENAAGGFGITQRTACEIFDAGADCITLGNHSFDQVEALSYIVDEPRLLRPYNYPVDLDIPGRGAGLYPLPDGRRVHVIQVMGRIFMDALDDPFAAVTRALGEAPLREASDAVVVEIHAETTSEKQAMGHYCDGHASLVVGAHTHIPTADAVILPSGTGYQTDAGMVGDYDSVIGMDKEPIVRQFATRLRTERKKPASGDATMCGVFVQTDDTTGLARRIAPIRVGGKLSQTVPEVE